MTSAAGTSAPLKLLLENQRAFLGFLERRVGNRAIAQDILHDAFVKVVARPELAPGDEGVIRWFYRMLRNAVIDRFRRQVTANRALESFAHSLETRAAPEPELRAEICACVTRLADTLKPEYAEALRAIEVEGTPVKNFAAAHGLSPNNAGVRVHRARAALKKRVAESCGVCAAHGCRNCTCRSLA
ncbi:MAG: sigma-70 family RNA polymerase sigma factor [Vicinamibacteria bacterium]|nr:sigma-70 family RNA polymerase sigma factor [Vicinamibacteria bacterium]